MFLENLETLWPPEDWLLLHKYFIIKRFIALSCTKRPSVTSEYGNALQWLKPSQKCFRVDLKNTSVQRLNINSFVYPLEIIWALSLVHFSVLVSGKVIQKKPRIVKIQQTFNVASTIISIIWVLHLEDTSRFFLTCLILHHEKKQAWDSCFLLLLRDESTD